MNCFQLCVFLIGFLSGVYLSILMLATEDAVVSRSGESGRQTDRERHRKWSQRVQITTESTDVDRMSFSQDLRPKLESDVMSESVKITCVVFVEKPDNAYAVANTWGKKCNRALYYSDKPVHFLDVNIFKEKHSWSFWCETIRTLSSYDWVVFAEDNIFLIPENLRFALLELDPAEPYYFGHNQIFWGVVYNTKSTAVVLSKGAISLLSTKFNTSAACYLSGKQKNNQDYLLGKYLRELGVLASDLRDDKGRDRFHIFTPYQLIAPGHDSVLEKYSKRSLHRVVQGENCCSTTSVSFKGTEGDKLFFYRYLLYNVQIFNSLGGLGNNNTKATNNTDEVWVEYVKDKLGADFNISLMTDDRYFELGQLLEHERDFSSLVKLQDGKLTKISIDSLDRT